MIRPTLYTWIRQGGWKWMKIPPLGQLLQPQLSITEGNRARKRGGREGAEGPVSILLYLFLSLESTTWVIFTNFVPSNVWADFNKKEQLWWIAASLARRREQHKWMHAHAYKHTHIHTILLKQLHQQCLLHLCPLSSCLPFFRKSNTSWDL